MCADVDEYESINSLLELKVVAPKDGCNVENALLDSDQSVAILPIDGGAKQGFTIVDSSETDFVIATAKCPPPPPPPVDTTASAKPVKFRTESLEANEEGNSVVHKVKWSSSTHMKNSLKDLKTREHVTWSEGVPYEWRPCEAGYERPDSHNGYAPTPASSGGNTDNHQIAYLNGCQFKGRDKDGTTLPNGQETAKWVQKQVYQYGKPEGDDQQPWRAMQHANKEDAEYTLTRWGVRDGNDMVIHMTKEAVNEPEKDGKRWEIEATFRVPAFD